MQINFFQWNNLNIDDTSCLLFLSFEPTLSDETKPIFSDTELTIDQWQQLITREKPWFHTCTNLIIIDFDSYANSTDNWRFRSIFRFLGTFS